MLHVELVAHTPMPEKLVAAAAKLCYSSVGAADIMEGLTEEKTDRFLAMLTELGHESPIEHATFTFAIEGVSRSVLAQITRHRIASFSVQSQRYVRAEGFSYVIPPAIERDEKARALFLQTMQDIQNAYDGLAEVLLSAKLALLEREGTLNDRTRAAAEKSAIEDARFVLPNACETKMLMTMNARSLYNFFRLRCCNRAQWEIRELAWRMFDLCREAAPTLFSKAGPACVRGACSEGKMTCGKMDEVRARAAQ
ncbi:MAG: FAD-dependent thymidylate synthase [Clostridium sp. SCN 57-10]|nr:MAG: FAD-dependent thymidylate synthase [Clostridium sp. SCN 57-10]